VRERERGHHSFVLMKQQLELLLLMSFITLFTDVHPLKFIPHGFMCVCVSAAAYYRKRERRRARGGGGGDSEFRVIESVVKAIPGRQFSLCMRTRGDGRRAIAEDTDRSGSVKGVI
jgi:hypothetical protein